MTQFEPVLDRAALEALHRNRPRREDFGPDSGNPFLAVEDDGLEPEIARWLADLPCPVIAVGRVGEAGWAADVVLDDPSGLPRIAANIRAAPLATMVLVQHLRASQDLTLSDAVVAESFAYAAVQQGPEFARWLRSTGPALSGPTVDHPVAMTVTQGTADIVLANPANRNAIDTHMRDALCEALDTAMLDPDIERVRLSGEGRCFSSGGDVAEFGQASDPATAHWVRSLRLPATRLARLHDRLEVHIDGAAIGAGLEMAAFGKRVTATSRAWFQLPELKYGLIPGAGGTASLPRRIGRQRTAWLALSMKRINAQTALDWGLVDEIVS